MANSDRKILSAVRLGPDLVFKEKQEDELGALLSQEQIDYLLEVGAIEGEWEPGQEETLEHADALAQHRKNTLKKESENKGKKPKFKVHKDGTLESEDTNVGRPEPKAQEPAPKKEQAPGAARDHKTPEGKKNPPPTPPPAGGTPPPPPPQSPPER